MALAGNGRQLIEPLSGATCSSKWHSELCFLDDRYSWFVIHQYPFTIRVKTALVSNCGRGNIGHILCRSLATAPVWSFLDCRVSDWFHIELAQAIREAVLDWVLSL
ncbi:MAG UNVERIFIED_CONTAM: hypothetical protein LVT10_13570 [Anaerolineae bacterium]